MAVTAAIVHIGHNHLRYLVTSTGGAGGAVTLTTTGAATPDVLTDSLTGPLKALAKAFTDGYGKLPAGALTQAQARALWLSNDPTNVVAVAGNLQVPTAICRARSTERTTAAATVGERAVVDANVDGSGHPTIIVTTVQDGTTYLDIEVAGTIGD
jgi:hypothetical protein